MLRLYIQLIKPGIILGNLITATAGFLFATQGRPDPVALFLTLFGMGCVIGAACICNNYIDRQSDQKMQRTQDRPLAQGVIKGKDAMVFAAAIGLCGTLILLMFTNVWSALLTWSAFIIYVLFYSFWKYHSVHATLVGSLAGALPPVIGYCAVTDRCDVNTLFLFILVLFWQMPHFYAIAIYRFDDYKAAQIPVFPVMHGYQKTKSQMAIYTFAFLIASIGFLLFQKTTPILLLTLPLLGIVWLLLALQGFRATTIDRSWARTMFRFSLLIILISCISIGLSGGEIFNQ